MYTTYTVFGVGFLFDEMMICDTIHAGRQGQTGSFLSCLNYLLLLLLLFVTRSFVYKQQSRSDLYIFSY